MTLQPSPCPFCSGENAAPYAVKSCHSVLCVACGGEGPEADSEVAAIEAWNRRAALASQAQPEQPKQDSVHLTSDAVVCAATAQPAETDMTALSIEWTDDIGTRHWATPSHALEVLKLFYDEWPGGVDEFEAEKRAAKLGADNASLVSNEKEESVRRHNEGLDMNRPSDSEMLDWLDNELFEHTWSGTIGEPWSWRMAGPYRHTLQRMRGNSLRAAIRAAMADKGEQQ